MLEYSCEQGVNRRRGCALFPGYAAQFSTRVASQLQLTRDQPEQTCCGSLLTALYAPSQTFQEPRRASHETDHLGAVTTLSDRDASLAQQPQDRLVQRAMVMAVGISADRASCFDQRDVIGVAKLARELLAE